MIKQILYKAFCEIRNGPEKAFYNGKWHHGKWVYGYPYPGSDFDKDKWFIYSLSKDKVDINTFSVDPVTINVFIGVNDRNGREIFTGDVVKTYFKGRKIYGAVEFNDTPSNNSIGYRIFWHVTKDSLEKFPEIFSKPPSEFEIVGNVYVFPEFLKVERFYKNE